MAGKEGAPKPNGTVDKGLEFWQKWNKFTLTAESVAIVGGAVYGVPWLVALGATGAVIDGAQMLAIDQVQKNRAKSPEKKPNVCKRFGDIFVRSKHKGTQREHALAA